MSVAGRVHARLVQAAQAGGPPDRLTVTRLVREEAPLLGPAELDAVVVEVLARANGLGPLEALLADPAVTEVMVNGPGRVWVERAGALQRVDLALDRSAVEHLIERIVAPLGLRVDRTSPMVDARLPDGSRVNAVVPPLAVDGPCLTIRRFSTRALPLRAFARPGTAALLRWAVRARMNVLVSGGTSSGKTTLLNTLAAEIPAGERIVTVEDAAELRLAQDPDGVPYVLQLPFGDSSALLEDLADAPVEGVGIDFYATSAEAVPEDYPKEIVAGVIDARSSALEDPADIDRFARELLERRPARLSLTPNGDLQFVPEPIAREKLARLGRARAVVEEGALV